MTTPSKAKPGAMVVAGLMSGTSADGIDVALVRIAIPRTASASGEPSLRLLGHSSFPFPRALRQAVLDAMNAPAIATAELARLNWRLGQAYAEAFKETLRRMPCRVNLIGCHGQTLYHQPKPERYAGRDVACTWQLGEMAMLAAESGVPVVSNFRAADMVAGGQAAPLVSLLDYVLFRDPEKGRVLQNLGGIGNLTALPPNARLSQVLAFDTGPGNMIIDQLMQQLFGKKYDRHGACAGQGRVLDSVIDRSLRAPFFRSSPPKSAGREQFGREYCAGFLAACTAAGGKPADAVASATALTARSVRLAYTAFVGPRMRRAPVDFIVSGGGAKNATLMRLLQQELAPQGCRVQIIDEYGLPSQAKEAAAFALLAYRTWHRLSGNVPSATGARRAVILGNITYA